MTLLLSKGGKSWHNKKGSRSRRLDPRSSTGQTKVPQRRYYPALQADDMSVWKGGQRWNVYDVDDSLLHSA